MTEGSGSGIRILFFHTVRIRPRKVMDPDSVCPAKLIPDPDSVNIKPKPWGQLIFQTLSDGSVHMFSGRKMHLYPFAMDFMVF